jgi:dihydroneopterin aldolase
MPICETSSSGPQRPLTRMPFGAESAATDRVATTVEEWLCVEGLEFDCTIGLSERERHIKQRVVVNLRIYADFTAVKASDSIDDTVDYRAVARTVIAAGEASSFQLIEALAAHLGRTVLDRFPRVQRVRVELGKPGALTAAKGVSVALETARGEL